MVTRSSLDSLGTILSGLAKRLGLESRLLELRLQHQWREMLGEPIASHTWPDQIRFKKLYLVVRNSVWLQQLTFLKPALLAKINAESGTELVTEIVLHVGEIPAHSRETDSATNIPAQPVVSEAALTEASAHAASVQDPDLRTRLTQVMVEALSRSSR